jgi:4-hydroxy-3-methylbut-2-enyl diphosphate reductase
VSNADVEIRIAKEAGACYGVERALRMVQDALAKGSGPVSTLGPLIHNPVVVADLERRGVAVVDAPEQAAGSTLVLRTHGVTPEVEQEARRVCAHVIDATCPFVKRAHRAAETLSKQGYQVIVVGEAGHPEVEGTLGHAKGAVVIANARELANIKVQRKVGVVVQTTMTRARLREVIDGLLGRCEELRLVNTICEATSSRQKAAAELADDADVMVVIGGRNSANTSRLAEICQARCPCTHHIEEEGELEPAWFEAARLIGVTAGASTPNNQIDAVCRRIAKLC